MYTMCQRVAICCSWVGSRLPYKNRKKVPFANERKAAQFGLAVCGRSRAVIWALRQIGYP